MALIIKKPWTSQPQVAAGIDWGSPIAQGLSFVQTSGPYEVTKNTFGALVGTKQVASARGISRGYGATLGVGVTDSLTTTKTDHATRRTYFALVNLNSANSGGARGRIFDKRTGAIPAQVELFYCSQQNAAENYFAFGRTFSTTGGEWGTPIGSSAPGTWQAVTATYDSSSASNAPLLYINGVSQTVTTFIAASGTLVDNAAPYVVGNRTNDNARNFDGQIACLYFWDRILTAAEVKSVSDNPWQIFAPLQRTLWTGDSVVVTIGRPGSDITTTGWTGVPDNVTKYTNIDEASASDTDYIFSPPVTGTVAPIIFGIEDQTGAINTLPAGTWDVNVRSRFSEGLTASQIRVTLLDSGGTSVGASSWQTVTASFTDYVLSITTTGIAARIKIEAQ